MQFGGFPEPLYKGDTRFLKRWQNELIEKIVREDLSVSFDTVERWIQILERLFMVYRIMPYGSPKIRAVKKEKKLYFWHWAFVEDEGARWENMVASHLLKYCDFMKDVHGEKMELRFLRDIDGREIDFVILQNGKPKMAIECKTGEKSPSRVHNYFRERTNIPEFYQVTWPSNWI